MLTVLHAFLTARVPEATDIRIDDLTPVSGGNARKAYSFDLVMGDGEGHLDVPCIMLMQAGSGQLESDLTAEFRVIEALNDTDVPSPRALWLDADGSALGAPTVIMERVPGVTDILALRATEPAARNPFGNIGLRRGGRETPRRRYEGAGVPRHADARDPPPRSRLGYGKRNS